MTIDTSTPRKPLRLWPGVAAAVLLVLAGYVVPLISRENALFGMLGQSASR